MSKPSTSASNKVFSSKQREELFRALEAARATYVRRIIANLSTNAIQAMPSGGKLTINPKRKNGKTELKRSDTGEGIPEALRDQAFKPLFTTKSKGQGFRLEVVKKFVEKLGGTVSFSSEANVGTTFIVQLP